MLDIDRESPDPLLAATDGQLRTRLPKPKAPNATSASASASASAPTVSQTAAPPSAEVAVSPSSKQSARSSAAAAAKTKEAAPAVAGRAVGARPALPDRLLRERRPPAPDVATADADAAQSEYSFGDAERTSTGASSGGRRYTFDENLAILQWLLRENEVYRMFGLAVWKRFSAEKVLAEDRRAWGLHYHVTKWLVNNLFRYALHVRIPSSLLHLCKFMISVIIRN